MLKRLPADVVWKLGDKWWELRCLLVTCQWFKIARFFTKSPQVAEQYNINIHSLILKVAVIAQWLWSWSRNRRVMSLNLSATEDMSHGGDEAR
ncbi:hypothetical protein TNCV_2422461 [Trichonephila clavipes]|nr:hypothetical protein TNCV_2422461 [Trichonephila clavipes]